MPERVISLLYRSDYVIATVFCDVFRCLPQKDIAFRIACCPSVCPFVCLSFDALSHLREKVTEGSNLKFYGYYNGCIISLE